MRIARFVLLNKYDTSRLSRYLKIIIITSKVISTYFLPLKRLQPRFPQIQSQVSLYKTLSTVVTFINFNSSLNLCLVNELMRSTHDYFIYASTLLFKYVNIWSLVLRLKSTLFKGNLGWTEPNFQIKTTPNFKVNHGLYVNVKLITPTVLAMKMELITLWSENSGWGSNLYSWFIF